LSGVTAVVVGSEPRDDDAVPRDQVARIVPVGSLSDLREAAERADTELLWLLDSGAVPTEGTLPALLGAGHVPAVSLPVDGAGAACEAAVGRFVETDVATLIDAARARLVPLRHTFVTSLLVTRASVIDLAPPDAARFGPYAGTEWTGRLFAGRPAVLVPASRIRVGALDRASPLQAARAARAGRWGRGETLRELYRSVAG
jgi:hypothetical protein